MSKMLERALAEAVQGENERAIKGRKRPTKLKVVVTTDDEALAEALSDAGEITTKVDAKPKAKTKKPKPKAKAKTRKVKKPKGTPAQLKAAKGKIKRTDWVKTIASFRANAGHNNARYKMGTPGSAQVTKARLDAWEGFKGLSCFTKGEYLFVTKLKTADAKAAAKKAGF
jgi:hypothetical protein